MRAGVTVIDPATTWVDVDVTLEPDVVSIRAPSCTAVRPSRRARRSGPPPR